MISKATAIDLHIGLTASRSLNRAPLLKYRSAIEELAPSTINVRLAAMQKIVTEAHKNGVLSIEEANHLTEIPKVMQKGTRLGFSLTREQAKELLAVPTGRPSRENVTM